MAMSASPDSHLDLQKDQFRHTPDVIESDKPNDAVARHPEVRVSAGHRSLVSDNQPLCMLESAGE